MKKLALLALLSGAAVASQAQTLIYSNTTTFGGQAFANGGAAVDPSNPLNTITTLVADDIQTAYGGTGVTAFTFSVANFNTAITSARPLVRFFAADGVTGGPGTFLGGLNFNAISFNPGSVATFNYSSGTTPIFTIPTGGKFFAGIVFDNNGGATTATATTLNNLGQGIYNPPTVGTSADTFFVSTLNGSNAASNPVGTMTNFSGNPQANFGWRFTTAVPEPATFAVLGLGALGLLRRRSKKA